MCFISFITVCFLISNNLIYFHGRFRRVKNTELHFKWELKWALMIEDFENIYFPWFTSQIFTRILHLAIFIYFAFILILPLVSCYVGHKVLLYFLPFYSLLFCLPLYTLFFFMLLLKYIVEALPWFKKKIDLFLTQKFN